MLSVNAVLIFRVPAIEETVSRGKWEPGVGREEWNLDDHLPGMLLLLFDCSVASNSLQPRALQQARLPRPPASPGVRSNSCPLCPWCHPTMSSSVAPSPPAPSLSQHQALCIKWPKYWCFSFRLSPSNGGNVTGALINMWKRGVISFEILSCWKIEDLYTFRAWAKLVTNKMAQKGHGLHQHFSVVGPFTPGEHLAMAGDIWIIKTQGTVLLASSE